MAEINLLRSLPKSKRKIKSRESTKTDDHIRISREYSKMYFDGPREYGYGGYKYDGRWKPVAKDVISHFNLKPGDKVLDVGCAKGFLVKDLLELDIDAYGIDVSEYALENCEKALKISPDEDDLLELKALICLNMDKYDLTEKLLLEMLDHDPSDPTVHYNLACLMKIKHWQRKQMELKRIN